MEHRMSAGIRYVKAQAHDRTHPALPTDEGTYVLDVDASNFGLGAVLSQKQFGTEQLSHTRPEL